MTGFPIPFSSRINLTNRCKSLNKIMKTKTRISMIYLVYSSQLAYHNNSNSLLTKMLIHLILAWLSQPNSNQLTINSSSSNLTFLEISKTIIPLKHNNNSKMSYSNKFYSNLILLRKNLLSRKVLRVQTVNLEVILMTLKRMQDSVEQWLEWVSLKFALSSRKKVNLKLQGLKKRKNNKTSNQTQ